MLFLSSWSLKPSYSGQLAISTSFYSLSCFEMLVIITPSLREQEIHICRFCQMDVTQRNSQFNDSRYSSSAKYSSFSPSTGSTIPKRTSILPKRGLIIPKGDSTLPQRGPIIPKRGSIIAFMKAWSPVSQRIWTPPPGPNSLADMDSPAQIWTPYQTFLLSIVCIIFGN